MVEVELLRLDNILYKAGKLIKVTSIAREQFGYVIVKGDGAELFTSPHDQDLFGVEITTEIIKELLQFVPYGDNNEDKSMPEYTDGRIILRVTEKGIAVFTPIDMPWATPDFPLQMYYITMIIALHELQNLYRDLFKVNLDY